MNYIVLDLEATCWRQDFLERQQEVIEIGAFRLNPYGEVKDRFQRFVRPGIHPRLSYYCMELTGIEQHFVDKAYPFPEVCRQFIEWAKFEEEDYALFAWGRGDRRLLLSDCNLHDIDPWWVQPYIDLKDQYQEIRGLSRPAGLLKALEREGFEFEGNHHRALDDAHNLLNIFVRYLDEWKF